MQERESARAAELKKRLDDKYAALAEEAKHTAAENARKQAAEAEERAEKEAVEAAQNFERSRPAFEKQMSMLNTMIQSQDWLGAESFSAKFENELEPLFRSSVVAAPAVAALKSQHARMKAAIEKHRLAEWEVRNAYDSADARTDLQVIRSSWQKGGFGVVALWNVTIKNTSRGAVFSDIEYRTEYSAPSGTFVGSSEGKILDVIKPGQTRRFEVNDGFINSQAGRASFTITGATKTSP